MHPDWIAILAFLAACSGLAGYGAYTGADREAGRLLMVVGAIVGLLATVLSLTVRDTARPIQHRYDR